jgi:hypothetical protein
LGLVSHGYGWHQLMADFEKDEMTNSSVEDTEVHPLVVEIMKAIHIDEDEDKTIIPRKKIVEFNSRLKNIKQDKIVFEHLAVMYSRLLEENMPQVAHQLLALAKIGLKSSHLESTIEGITRNRKLNPEDKIDPPQIKGLKQPMARVSNISKTRNLWKKQ